MTTNNEKPLISVIIPVYNGERYLAEAIDSVLAQTYRPIEIIIVNDGSTDNSAKVVKCYASSIHYYYQANCGMCASRNKGFSLAKGMFLAFLDQDDLWWKNRLACQMTAFDNDPQLDMVFGYIRQFHSPDLEEKLKQKIYCPKKDMPGYHPGAMLIQRGAFLRVGLFETSLKSGEFLDWYSRAREQGLKELLQPEVVMKRRLHASNTWLVEHQLQTDYVKALKMALDRRRKQNGYEQQREVTLKAAQ